MSVRSVFLIGLLFSSLSLSSSESQTCLTVYREGGAPAVFRSANCPRWTLSSSSSGGGSRRPVTEDCQVALLLGRRRSQEDRAVCALDIRIPFIGRTGVKEVSVGIAAVFDGHNGDEASEMASKLLLEYFYLHVYFLLDGIYSSLFKKPIQKLIYKGERDALFQVFKMVKEETKNNLYLDRIEWMLPRILDGSLHMEILKESLLRTIHDIDETFSKEAIRKNLDSGTTATVVLIADNQILVANVGDSRALLCSKNSYCYRDRMGELLKLRGQRRRRDISSSIKKYENLKVSISSEPTYFCVRELTADHHPDRDDERQRVEEAGGYVVEWAGVPRINGELAVSRAIGDVSFKNYGVISVPEVTDWQPLTSNDSYLVVVSDGIFEKMKTQDICEILWDDYIKVHEKSGFSSINRHSLADHIVSTAFEKGSMDNMAALVIPLQYTDVFETSIKETCNIEKGIDTSTHGLPKIMHRKSDNGAPSSGLVSMDFASKIMSKFNRLLVETKQTSLGCFHLSENLNDNSDYVFPAQKDHDELNDLSHALLGPPDYLLEGRPPGTYDAQKFCWHFEMDTTDKGQCINHESFVKFLGLLESIPLDINGSNSSESYAFDTMEYRYILKKRFDRGSYGEVWLARHWNCSRDDDSASQMRRNITCMCNDAHHDPYEHGKSGGANSSDEHYNSDSNDDDMVILKRIMVERGVAAYLSGLREKYFGEVFLNASMSLEAMGTSAMFPKEEDYEAPYQFYAVKEVRHAMSYIWNAVHMSPSSSRILTGDSEEGLRHIARYIESFESPSKEIWLVFRNEGFSLSKLMYTTEEQEETIDNERFGRVNNVQVLHPSAWWYWLRTTDAGKEEMRSLIWQLLMALKSCHDRNITHRDIKPENMIVCYKDVQTGRCLRRMPIGEKRQHLQMRIIDFGSAIDEFTLKYLYGSGPTRSEQTSEYTSPEALLNANWFQASKSIVLKYDMWSVGVVMLELILGTPHVFQISSRTRALLDHHLEHWSEDTKELAYKLRSLMEMCILIPGSSPKHYKIGETKAQAVWPASWKCSEEFFSNQIKSRDPLGLGFPNIWALRLVRQLLFWHPEDRLSVDEAMRHPYFRPHPRT